MTICNENLHFGIATQHGRCNWRVVKLPNGQTLKNSYIRCLSLAFFFQGVQISSKDMYTQGQLVGVVSSKPGKILYDRRFFLKERAKIFFGRFLPGLLPLEKFRQNTGCYCMRWTGNPWQWTSKCMLVSPYDGLEVPSKLTLVLAMD